MKFSNIFHLLLAGLFVAGTSSCMDEVKYTPAEKVDLAEYYFSTGNPTQEDLEEGQSTFTILLGRLDTTDELTVPVTHNIDAPENVSTEGVFTIPDQVTFAAGEGTALLTVSYDEAKLMRKEEYKLSFGLDGIQDTPYYLGKLDVTCIYNPWITLGTGTYTDVIISSVFDLSDVGGPFTYGVKVQEHPDIKGYYRIDNPYAPGTYPLSSSNFEYSGNHYIYIHAEKDDEVYIETSNLGINMHTETNYGRFLVSSTAYLALEEGSTIEDQKKAGNLGEVISGNIFMPVNKLEIAMELYNKGAWSFNNSEEFHLILPGYQNYDKNWEEIGMCNFTDGFAGPFMKTPQRDHTYKVLVQRNKQSKNLIRIVDPFGAESGYSKPSSYSPSEYIEFDVTEPGCVVLTDTIITPITTLATGTYMATTEANHLLSQGLSLEEIADEGIGGSFKDNVIRIPGQQIMCYLSRKLKDEPTRQTAPYTDVVLDLNSATQEDQPAVATAARPVTPRRPLKLR